MSESTRYRVTGEFQSTGMPSVVEIEAAGEADARARAELGGIVVKLVEAVPGGAPNPRPRKLRTVIFATLGWLFVTMALLTAVAILTRRSHARATAIDDLVSGKSQDVARAIGFLVGMNIAGILALVFGIGVVWTSARRGGKTLVALSLLSIVAMTVGAFRPTSVELVKGGGTTQQQAAATIRDLGNLVGQSKNPPTQGASVPAAAPALTETYGDMAFMVKATQEAFEGIRADREQYAKGVAESHIVGLLKAERLTSAEEIVKSKLGVAAAQECLDTYRASVKARIQHIRKAIQEAPYTPETKVKLLGGFEKGQGGTARLTDLVLTYDAEMYEELDALLDFMLSRQGAFSDEGNKLRFKDNNDAQVFNASLNRYRAIAAKQGEAQTQLQEKAKSLAARSKEVADSGGNLFPPEPKGAETKVSVSPEHLSIEGSALTLPLQKDRLVSLLGQPSRTLEKSSKVLVWDDRGVFATEAAAGGEIETIDFLLNRQRQRDYYPTSFFAGEIMLGGWKVRDIDTPRSMNRHLKDLAFEGTDEFGIAWELQFHTFGVEMLMDNAGLADVLTVRLRPAATDAKEPAEKPTQKPKF